MQLLLQPLHLRRHVAESAGPAGFRKGIERFTGVVPAFLVDLCFGQLEQSCWLQPSQFGDSFPMGDCFAPAVLFLAELREGGVIFGFVRSGFNQ